MTLATLEAVLIGSQPLTADRLARLGQLSALEDGLLDHDDGDRMRSVLRVDLRPELPDDVLAALTAAASPDEINLPAGEIPWTSPALMFTDQWTNEGRVDGGRLFHHAGGSHGALPLPLMVQRTTSAMGGHDGAVSGGRIDSIDLSTAGPIPAAGVFADTPEGRAAAWDYAQGYLSGVSVDLRITGYELDYITEVDDDGEEWIVDADFRATEWEIMGATGTPFPAFADARLEVAAGNDTAPADDEPGSPAMAAAVHPWTTSTTAGSSLTVSTTLGGLFTDRRPALVAGAQHHPPADWFRDPNLTEPTPPTLVGDWYYGHAALWTDENGGPSCHIGYSDQCVCPPHSARGYARFLVGEVEASDGTRHPVGSITLRGGHAPTAPGVTEADARAHYDDTDSAVAYVTCGEDEHGLWFSGCVRPGLSDDDRFVLAASSLSGDWREYPARSGNLELVRLSAVNTPGFPVLRASGEPLDRPTLTVEDGRVVALAASGAGRLARLKAEQLAADEPVTRGDLEVMQAEIEELDARIERLEAMTDGMEPEARARLLARLSAP